MAAQGAQPLSQLPVCKPPDKVRRLHLRWLHIPNTPPKHTAQTKPTNRRRTQWFKQEKKKLKKSLWYVTLTATGQTVLSLCNHPISRDVAAFRKTQDNMGFVPGPAADREGTDSEAPISVTLQVVDMAWSSCCSETRHLLTMWL